MSHLPNQQSNSLIRSALGASGLASQSLINKNFFDNVKQLKSGEAPAKLSLKDQHLQNFWGRWLRDGSEEKPEKQQAAHNDGGEMDSTDYEHDDDAFGVRRPSGRQNDYETAEDTDDWSDDDDDSGGEMMPIPGF